MKKFISTVLALGAAAAAIFAFTGAKKASADACCPDCTTCAGTSACCDNK